MTRRIDRPRLPKTRTWSEPGWLDNLDRFVGLTAPTFTHSTLVSPVGQCLDLAGPPARSSWCAPHEPRGELTDRYVGSLRRLAQQVKRLVRPALTLRHQDTLGLLDDWHAQATSVDASKWPYAHQLLSNHLMACGSNRLLTSDGSLRIMPCHDGACHGARDRNNSRSWQAAMGTSGFFPDSSNSFPKSWRPPCG